MQWWDWMRQSAARLFATSGTTVIGVLASGEVSPEYPPLDSMSAIAAFPLARACFRAKAIDLAGLPLVAIKTRPDGRKERIHNHPIVDALTRSHFGRGSTHLRAQMSLDWWLTGDGYLYQRLPKLGGLSPIVRLHPNRVRLHGDEWGTVARAQYQTTTTRVELDLDALIHVSDISWREGLESVLGTGAIQCLHEELTADMAVRELTTKAAKRGRLEALISPKDKDQDLDDDEVKKIRDGYDNNRKSGHGALVVGSALEVTPLSLTPRDIEWAAMNERTAAAIMAVSGVPPVRIGLPSANYGTSKQQMRNYWEGLQGEAKLLDEQLSRLDPDPTVSIEHDFSRVEALQQSRTERLQRVRMWWEMGASAKAAAEYEGFVDSPLADDHFFQATGQTVFRQPEKPPDEGQERDLDLRPFLEESARRYQRRLVASEGRHVPAHHEEAVRFAVFLEDAGIEEDLAREVAEDTAALLDESVLQLTLASPGAVRIDVGLCPAFGAIHAARLAERLTTCASTREAA